MNDLISRQAAIEAIKRQERHDIEHDFEFNDGLISAMNAVSDVPTAEPECYMVSMAESMDIDRLKGIITKPSDITIIPLPKAQPQRKKGKWIKHEDRSCWYCSECHSDNYFAYSWNNNTGEYEFQDKFCPNCGAEMEKGEEDG